MKTELEHVLEDVDVSEEVHRRTVIDEAEILQDLYGEPERGYYFGEGG